MHQRLFLCAMCNLSAFDQDTTFGRVQDVYRKLCETASMVPLRDELFSSVDALVCSGLVKRLQSREKRDGIYFSCLFITSLTHTHTPTRCYFLTRSNMFMKMPISQYIMFT